MVNCGILLGVPVRNWPSKASNCWLGIGDGTLELTRDVGSKSLIDKSLDGIHNYI